MGVRWPIRKCGLGVHYPEPETVERQGELRRGRCRFCGCAIVRMESARRWIFSGQLG